MAISRNESTEPSSRPVNGRWLRHGSFVGFIGRAPDQTLEHLSRLLTIRRILQMRFGRLHYAPSDHRASRLFVAGLCASLCPCDQERIMKRPGIPANSANLVWRNGLRRKRTIRAILSFEWALRAFLSYVYCGLLFAESKASSPPSWCGGVS